MARTRKTWTEKLSDSKDLPKLVEITAEMRTTWGTGLCLVPAPRDVDAVMRKVPSGKVTTTQEIRESLAAAAGASMTCPLTTGIFTWIAANAAQESEESGKSRMTPWWRTLKSGGELNPKFPGGLEEQRSRLEAEGHTVICRGKRMFVRDFELALWKPRRPAATRPAGVRSLQLNGSPAS